MIKDEIHTAEDRIDRKWIYAIGVSGIVITAASIWVAWMLLVSGERAISGGRPAPPAKTAPAQISGVRQTLIQRDLEGIRTRDEVLREIERWSWADREKRLVNMPIQRAMELRAKGVTP